MEDDDLIPISALQHYLYCSRQYALIHIEQQWAENRHTVEGRVLHDRADAPGSESRQGVRTVRALPLSSTELGIAGKADVVEFRAGPEGAIACPVEYKRGRPKSHRADEVQLCAQALCLEAMLSRPVPEGMLFYGQTRRRKAVAFDADLRKLTLETIAATRALFQSRRTPSATYDSRRCDACSLIDLCQPKELARSRTVQQWLQRATEDVG